MDTGITASLLSMQKPANSNECGVLSATSPWITISVLGQGPGPGPDQFSIVHAIRVSNDGIVYIPDRENRRVQSFTIAGKVLKQLVRTSAPFARAQKFLSLAEALM